MRRVYGNILWGVYVAKIAVSMDPHFRMVRKKCLLLENKAANCVKILHTR